MELFVGALAVLGFLAIIVRFLPRDAAGRIQLPRIIDQSIGMWLVRRAIARRRAQQSRPAQPARPDVVPPRPDVVPPRPWIARPARPLVVPPEPAVAQPARATVARVPRGLRLQPSEAYRRGAARVAQGLVAVVALTTVLTVGFALGMVALRPPTAAGEVLAATGTPGPPPNATASQVTADTTAPTAAIVGLSKKPIPGSTLIRVTVTWTLTESGTGIGSQVLQRRIDGGAWETIALPSSRTRSLTQRLPRGHKYTFRVRGIDRAGNVGVFASRHLYI